MARSPPPNLRSPSKYHKISVQISQDLSPSVVRSPPRLQELGPNLLRSPPTPASHHSKSYVISAKSCGISSKSRVTSLLILCDLSPNLKISQSNSHEISFNSCYISFQISSKSHLSSLQFSHDLGSNFLISQSRSHVIYSKSHDIKSPEVSYKPHRLCPLNLAWSQTKSCEISSRADGIFIQTSGHLPRVIWNLPTNFMRCPPSLAWLHIISCVTLVKSQEHLVTVLWEHLPDSHDLGPGLTGSQSKFPEISSRSWVILSILGISPPSRMKSHNKSHEISKYHLTSLHISHDLHLDLIRTQSKSESS